MRLLTLAALAVLTLAGCSQPPVNRDGAKPLTTEPSVDLDRYVGKWFEIARFPNEFETDCVGVTAEYAKREDGRIDVVNTCRKKTLDGEIDKAEGVAKIVDQQTKAKLAVSFDPFGAFFGDYWILDVADDYSWVLVGEPGGRYLWILSRTPTIGDDLKSQLLQKLKTQGYKTEALYFTPQPPKT